MGGCLMDNHTTSSIFIFQVSEVWNGQNDSKAIYSCVHPAIWLPVFQTQCLTMDTGQWSKQAIIDSDMVHPHTKLHDDMA